MNSAPTRFERFRDLHLAAEPLLLPNGWDFVSIAVLADAGFGAIGTTSLGVAAAAGNPDAAGATRDETLGLARRASGLCLLSVDLEGGFSEDPDEVAALAVELADAGVVGINIEDGRADGTLADPDRQARLIAAIKREASGLFVNARTDTFWLDGGTGRTTETADRLRAYAAAGADGVFVPGVADGKAIEQLALVVDLPLNVLYTPGGPSLSQLATCLFRRLDNDLPERQVV